PGPENQPAAAPRPQAPPAAESQPAAARPTAPAAQPAQTAPAGGSGAAAGGPSAPGAAAAPAPSAPAAPESAPSAQPVAPAATQPSGAVQPVAPAGTAEALASAAATAPGAAPAAQPSCPAASSPPAQGEAGAVPAEAAQGGAPAPQAAPTETDKPTVIVRYGAMGLVGRFICTLSPWRCGQRVVIKSDRGQEVGSIVCAWDGCGAPRGVGPMLRGEVLRTVTHADEVEQRHLRDSERREFAFSKECVARRGLPMKVVAVEHLFGGDRIIFYFVAETRVDFRALVRDLAHEFQTRIEMRQIGVRDEARLLGDYERCGRPLCCRAWIKELQPVSMKMAKVQKATLDPTKISGRCGRLMCCLRFEHATYRDLARNLPRKNALVVTAEGPGKVVATDVVAQMVGVLLLSGNRVNVPVEALVSRGPDFEAGVAAVARAGGAAEAGEAPEDLGDEPETIEMVAEAPEADALGADALGADALGADAPDAGASSPAAPPPAAAPAGPPPAASRPSGQPPAGPAAQGEAAAGTPALRPPEAGGPQAGQPQGDRRGRRGRRRSRRGGRNRHRPGGGPYDRKPETPPAQRQGEC
ncbi:MAG: hypothetical protein FJ288_18495, partial [Planctomycetes bacterium]|nr:hypothetical protein [Planctomycetota bacterium]